MSTEADRITELENEVKALSRLVRETVAREKLMETRLKMASKDAADAKKQLVEMDKISRKMDHRILALQSKMRYSG